MHRQIKEGVNTAWAKRKPTGEPKLVNLGINKVDKVFVSPYIRAEQTWAEVSKFIEANNVETLEDITPYGDANKVLIMLMPSLNWKTLNQCY